MQEIAVEYDAPQAARTLNHLTLLVIEAREITRMTLTLVLESAGAQVVVVSSPAEALTPLATRHFDAILTDIAPAGVRVRGDRLVLEGFPGPNSGAPIFGISGCPDVANMAVRHAAGMTLEIGGFIDPAAICHALADIAAAPRHAQAA